MFSDWWEEQIRLEVKKTKKEMAITILQKCEEFYKMCHHKGNAIWKLTDWIKNNYNIYDGE